MFCIQGGVSRACLLTKQNPTRPSGTFKRLANRRTAPVGIIPQDLEPWSPSRVAGFIFAVVSWPRLVPVKIRPDIGAALAAGRVRRTDLQCRTDGRRQPIDRR
jgi:hypothetical protein